ncbi:MAG: NAD(P)-dependent alcohol dehydrogenase [Leptospirales bacterium]|nr:NAD(P)-dependent alcohol dehydrogenase [Leptospirales bacterium]
MKSFEIQSGFGLDNLKLVDRADPVPGHGEVLVRMRAASLNFRDYLTVIGQYNPRYKLPLVPGSDGAGEVLSVGPGVEEWKSGDRVMSCFALDWLSGIPGLKQVRNSSLGGPLDGTLTELRVFPARSLVAIPEALSYEEAATLPCAGVTAWSALATETQVLPGQVVVVLGTGGVSIFALQFAKMMGAVVIVTSSSGEKLAKAQALGADHVINYRDKPAWSKEVRRITAMEGADHIIEVGGAGTLEESLKAVKFFGHISLIGILAGSAKELNLLPILMQNVRMQGVLVGSRNGLEQSARAIEAHKIKPVIDRTFPFSETRAAIQYLADGKHFGKVSISIP